MSEYIKNEKAIQERMTKKIESILNTSIKDETLAKSKSLQADYGDSYKSYILKNEFIEAIKRLNPFILNNPDILASREVRIEAIWEDFSTKYNRTHQDGLHHLFINMDHEISFQCQDGVHKFKYFILDQNFTERQCSHNRITVIREKALYLDGDKYQYPDFAVYCNGLPFILIEVKNPQTTYPLIEALDDFRSKKSYHRFMLFMATDGNEAGIMASYDHLSNIASWRNYGRHIRDKDEMNGFLDFFHEIINNQMNLMLFCKFGIFSITPDKNNPTKTILSTARVQQYFLIKSFFYKLREYSSFKGDEPFRCLVKHPARSGKTISARSCIEMTLSLFHNKFDKIFIQAPDTKIAEQFWKDCHQFDFANNIPVHKIECRRRNSYHNNFSYEEAITSESKGIYIMNMQKIDSEEVYAVNNSHKVLFIIDEVHTHQNAEMSSLRDMQFPNASYLAFTATPRVKKKHNESTDLYNDGKNEYFDELTNNDALGLSIVVPVLYFKLNYDIHTNKENINRFGREYTDLIHSKFEDSRKDAVCYHRDDENCSISVESVNPMEDGLPGLRDANKEISKGTNALLTALSRQNIEDRINFIINFKEKEDKQTYSNKFKTKAFWVVDSKKDALAIIDFFNKNIKSHTYRGHRFAVDFSAEDYHMSDILSDFSGVAHDDIIHHFSSGDEDSIDILILVSKYLKGYDNKDLCYVFCDTSVKEPTKVYQLFTRPGTIRKNKPLGFFVDMSLNDDNYKTLLEAVGYYEYNNKIAPTIFSEEAVEEIQQKIRNIIESIADCCDMDIPKLRIELRQNIKLFFYLSFDRKNILCEQVNQLIKITKNVPNRCIGISNNLDIHMVARAFKYLMSTEIENNKKAIYFTQEKHIEMMKDLMKVLNINNLNELLDISLNHEVHSRYIDMAEDNTEYDINDFFGHNSGPQISSSRNSFSDALNKKITDIENSNWSDGKVENYSKEKSVIQTITESYTDNDYPIPEYSTHQIEWERIIAFLEPKVKEAEERNRIVFGQPIPDRYYKQFKNKLIEQIELSEEMKNVFSDDNNENYYKVLHKLIIYILEK